MPSTENLDNYPYLVKPWNLDDSLHLPLLLNQYNE